jgi:regulator of replication initiation timing
MSGLDKNRLRNQTICFRATPEERQQIEGRITVSGMPKGQYYIQSLLHQQINIIVGKYQSDRLSLEIRRLRERLDEPTHIDPCEINQVLTDCKALLEQLAEIMENNRQEEKITIEDFATEK